MCEAYSTKSKRVRTDTRMILHVEGVHGQRYRDWCLANGVTVRHGLGKLHERLNASEEGRRLAVEQRGKWERKYWQTQGMTAWDHVRAAVGKRPVVAFGLAAVSVFNLAAVARIVWGML